MTHTNARRAPAAVALPPLGRLHRDVKTLADCVGRLRDLLCRYPSVGVGLVRLDTQLQLHESEDLYPDDPERSAEWRSLVDDLRVYRDEVTSLWEQELCGPDTSLRLDFAGVGDEVACGTLHDLSYHGLVISLASVILDPSVLGDDGGVIRLRAVTALLGGELDPGRLYFSLDREFAKVRSLERETGERLANSPGSSPEDHVQPGDEVEVENLPTKREGPTKVEQALGVLVSNPELSNRQIAKQVGCCPSLLSRDERFRKAREIQRQERKRFEAPGAAPRDRRRGRRTPRC